MESTEVEQLPETGNYEYGMYVKTHISNYQPDPIAVKLGFVCPICEGVRNMRPMYGEKICVCNQNDKEAEHWIRERERKALYICSKISYEAGFICEECHKTNEIWGQTEETANTCNYCEHKQEPAL